MAYAGFDRDDCPGLEMMARLKGDTNFAWCSFYLPAPSNRGSTWKGMRAALKGQGWGFAPIFAGQQITGPGARNTTAMQGKIDGFAATNAMSQEGFPSGSYVYLDLENGPPFTAAQREYVGAWIDAVNGGFPLFRAGVYCSFLFAAEVAALRPGIRLWVFHLEGAAIRAHLVNGLAFGSPEPSASGFSGAVVWQHDDEARLTAFGGLACDLDSSTMLDPSAPGIIAAKAPPAPAIVLPAPILPEPAYIPPAAPVTPAGRPHPVDEMPLDVAPGVSESVRLILVGVGVAVLIAGLAAWFYFR